MDERLFDKSEMECPLGGTMRLVAVGDSNWNYYRSAKFDAFFSVPKEGPAYEGCKMSFYGDLNYWKMSLLAWNRNVVVLVDAEEL
jgi:hypothetical protein